MAGVSTLYEKGEMPPLKLDGITSETKWNNEFLNQTMQNLRVGGFVSPTEGTLKPLNFGNNLEAGLDQVHKSVLNFKGANGFSTDDTDYRKMRFDFITAEESYSPTTYMLNGVPHIGYGFNLEAPGNKELAMETLKISESEWNNLKGKSSQITEREGRLLFEAAVRNAEKVVQQKLDGVPLNANQRVALVSMAYNAPALIGPNITKALRSGNAAGVSFEILNRSNANKLKGLDNRRKREHDMFFAYDSNWTKVAKGDDLRKKPSGFSILNLFGISTAQADEFHPSGQQHIFQPKSSNQPNLLLASIATEGAVVENGLQSSGITVEPLVPGTGYTLDEVLAGKGLGDAPPENLTSSPRPPARPEQGNGVTSSPRPVLRPEGNGLDTSLRPVPRPDIATPEVKPEQTVEEKYGDRGVLRADTDPIRWNSLDNAVRVVYPTAWQRMGNRFKNKPGIAPNDLPTPARAFAQYKLERSTFDWSTQGYGNDFFNPNELETLENFILWAESQGKTSIQYEDYDTFFGIRAVNGMYVSEMVGAAKGLARIEAEYKKRGLTRPSDLELHEAAYGTDSFLGKSADKYISLAKMAMDSHDPVMALALTIGRITWSRDEQGRIIVEDDYNFTKQSNRGNKAAYHSVRGNQNDDKERPAFRFKLILN